MAHTRKRANIQANPIICINQTLFIAWGQSGMCSCWQLTRSSISVASLCYYASDSNHDKFKIMSGTLQQQLTGQQLAVPCCAVLCCAVLCCAVLCCAVLWVGKHSSATCCLVRLHGVLSHAAQRVALCNTVQHQRAQKPLQKRHHDKRILMQRPARHSFCPHVQRKPQG